MTISKTADENYGSVEAIHDYAIGILKKYRSYYSGAWTDWVNIPNHNHAPVDIGAVPISRTINEKPLSSNIALNASDVGAAPSGYGLGTSSGKDCSDFNTAIDIGWYWMTGGSVLNGPPENGSFKYGCLRVERRSSYITQTAIINDIIAMRGSNDSGDTWGIWQHVNPGMQVGQEYPTTERWQGKVVYCKLVDLGTLPASATSEKDIVFFTGSMAELVSVDVSTHAGSTWRTEDTRWSKYVYKDDAGAHIVIKATENVSGYSGFAVFKYTKD